MSNNIVVYYHSPCHDGFLGQLLISRMLSDFATVTTVPLGHGPKRVWDTSIFTQPDTLVMFVDIAPHPAMLEDLVAVDNINEIQVWDHHIDFRNMYDIPWKKVDLVNFFNLPFEVAAPNQKTHFNFCNEISGSRLAPLAAGQWIFQHQDEISATYGVQAFTEADQNIPTMYNHPIVQHASDYDTWQKRLPHTDAVFAYYRNYSYADVDKWHQLLNRITSFDSPGYQDIVRQGTAMIEAIRSLAVKLCNGENPRPTVLSVPVNGQEVTFQGVVCNAYGLLANDVGEILLRDHNYDFAVMFNIEPNTVTLSIRAKPGIPANDIARMWGGGGHAGSAGAGISGEARIEWLNKYVFTT